MSTSGIYVDSYTTTRQCTVESIEGEDCDFDGEVEVTIDPEGGTVTEWWDCPFCEYEHVNGYEEDYDDFE